jgi:hypothetical protein
MSLRQDLYSRRQLQMKDLIGQRVVGGKDLVPNGKLEAGGFNPHLLRIGEPIRVREPGKDCFQSRFSPLKPLESTYCGGIIFEPEALEFSTGGIFQLEQIGSLLDIAKKLSLSVSELRRAAGQEEHYLFITEGNAGEGLNDPPKRESSRGLLSRRPRYYLAPVAHHVKDGLTEKIQQLEPETMGRFCEEKHSAAPLPTCSLHANGSRRPEAGERSPPCLEPLHHRGYRKIRRLEQWSSRGTAGPSKTEAAKDQKK